MHQLTPKTPSPSHFVVLALKRSLSSSANKKKRKKYRNNSVYTRFVLT